MNTLRQLFKGLKTLRSVYCVPSTTLIGMLRSTSRACRMDSESMSFALT
jgi:hypothetical protein